MREMRIYLSRIYIYICFASSFIKTVQVSTGCEDYMDVSHALHV